MSRDIERSVRKERAVRRERIATAVMAGLYANPAAGRPDQHLFARWAVDAADTLLAHLTAAESRDFLRALEAECKTESEVTA